jgi:hypothetical protein
MLEAQDLKTEDINMPEWGGPVRIRTLYAIERDEFDQTINKGVGAERVIDLKNFRARLLARCIVDENGDPVFTAADVDALGKKSTVAIGRLFDRAQALNGMTPTAVDVSEKNSESVPSAASSSV